MAIDKEITLNVNDQAFQRLQQKAETMTRNMIRGSRQFSASGKEVEQDLIKQIALMERRNRLNEQAAKTALSQARVTGQPAPQAAKAAVSEAQEMKMLIALMRENIETIRTTSRDEIKSNRAGIERQISASRTVGQLGPQGDEFALLRETFQRQDLGLEVDEQAEFRRQQKRDERAAAAEERRKRKARELRLARVQRATSMVAGTENEYTLLAESLSGIPYIGPALATVSGRAIAQASDFERQAVEYGRLHRFGRGALTPLMLGRAVGQGVGLEGAELGVTPADFLRMSNVYEGALKQNVSHANVANLIGVEKTLGLNPNVIQQVLSTTRYDPRAGRDPTRIFAQFDQFTKDTKTAITEIPELINTFSNAANQILGTRGTFDANALAATVTGISRQTGFRGQRLERLTGAFGNLGRTSNPVTRALLMRAFRETDPNASFVDIQEKMEGGLTEKSRPGLQRFFEIMRERTGGGDALVLALQTVLPELSIKDIRDIIKSGGFQKALQRDQIVGARDFVAEGKEHVTDLEKASAKVSSALELAGDDLVVAINKIKDAIDLVFEDIGKEDVGVRESKEEAERIAAQNKKDLETNIHR